MGLNRKRVNDLNWYFPQKLCESGLIKETNEQRVQAQYMPCFGMLQADINHVLIPIYLAGGGGEGRRKGRKERKKEERKEGYKQEYQQRPPHSIIRDNTITLFLFC